jgi:hypothetical protein
MPKKKVKKNVNVEPIKDHNTIQINIKQALDNEKKINPKNIFEKYENKNKKY